MRLLCSSLTRSCLFDRSLLLSLRSCSSTSDPPSSGFLTQPVEEEEIRVPKKPVSYFPDHLPYPHIRTRSRIRPWFKVKEMVKMHPLPEDDRPEWTDTPEYPEFVDTSREGEKKRVRMEWYEAVKRLPTAQQKLYEMTKHYSHLSVFLTPLDIPYNATPFNQFYTRTHLIRGSLPDQYNFDVDGYVDRARDLILDRIAAVLYDSRTKRANFVIRINYGEPKTFKSTYAIQLQENIINEVAGVIKKMLVSECQHLNDLQFDYAPAVTASWWHRDTPIPFRKNWWKNPTMNQHFVYKASHALHLRHNKPLPAPLSLEDHMCNRVDVPKYDYNPFDLGYLYKRQNHSTLPGFLPDTSDGFDFPYLLFQTRNKLNKFLNEEDAFDVINRKYLKTSDMLDGMAILSGFGWLSSFATHHGFTAYQNLTYPFTSNIVITDGQHWSFYVYQLNTQVFHSDLDKNDRQNICWSTGELKLFDSYENGQFKNVNNEVIKHILKFFMISPQQEVNYDLFPYLSEDSRTQEEADIMHYHLKRFLANTTNSFIASRKKKSVWEKLFYFNTKAPLVIATRNRPKYVFKYPPFFTN